MYKSNYDLFLKNVTKYTTSIAQDIYKNPTVIYIGKTDFTEEIRKNFEGLREIYKEADNKNAVDLQSTKEWMILTLLKNIEKLCEKEFGFKWFNLVIKHTTTSALNGTIKPTFEEIPRLSIKENKFYDVTHTYVCCVSIPKSYFDGTYYAGEITAMFLDYIGQLFDLAITFYVNDLFEYFFMFAKGKHFNEAINKMTSFHSQMYIDFVKENITIFKYLSYPDSSSQKLSFSVFSSCLYDMTDHIIDSFKIIKPHLKAVSRNKNYDESSLAIAYGYDYGFANYIIKRERYLNSNGSQSKKISNKPIKTGVSGETDIVFYLGMGCALLNMLINPDSKNQTKCKNILDSIEKMLKQSNFSPKMKKIIKDYYITSFHTYNDFINVEPAQKRYTAERTNELFKIYSSDYIETNLYDYIDICVAMQLANHSIIANL